MEEEFDQLWSDVTPVAQDDFAESVVPIAYAAGYKKLMGLFRSAMTRGEKSQRVIDLTALVLDENAANYTVWQYRRQCLYALGADLNEELNFVDQFSDDNPKNYQIWYHRRAIVDTMRHANREISFCDRVLWTDAKNYHCWAHLQYIVKTYGLWVGELERTDRLLSEDARNNSAWNYRWFVVTTGPDAVTPAILDRELQYTQTHILNMQLNESAWNYLRGLSDFFPSLKPSIKTFCVNLLQREADAADRSASDATDATDKILGFKITNFNPFAMSLLADILAQESEVEKNRAKVLYKHLMVIDSLRIKAWRWKLEKLDFAI